MKLTRRPPTNNQLIERVKDLERRLDLVEDYIAAAQRQDEVDLDSIKVLTKALAPSMIDQVRLLLRCRQLEVAQEVFFDYFDSQMRKERFKEISQVLCGLRLHAKDLCNSTFLCLALTATNGIGKEEITERPNFWRFAFKTIEEKQGKESASKLLGGLA